MTASGALYAKNTFLFVCSFFPFSPLQSFWWGHMQCVSLEWRTDWIDCERSLFTLCSWLRRKSATLRQFQTPRGVWRNYPSHTAVGCVQLHYQGRQGRRKKRGIVPRSSPLTHPYHVSRQMKSCKNYCATKENMSDCFFVFFNLNLFISR